jgi:hypothetical protein
MGRRTEAVQADTPTIACHFRERQPIRPEQSSGAAATGSSKPSSAKA